nr:MAG TPA: hypothetical protein [Caudoviricetes sp.]
MLSAEDSQRGTVSNVRSATKSLLNRERLNDCRAVGVR